MAGKKREAGAEKSWAKMRKDGLVKYNSEELQKAKELIDAQIASAAAAADVLPIFLDYRDHEGLEHSFVALPQDDDPGYRVGCVARADMIQEGYIGHGSFGRVSLLQWENGVCDAIKIEPKRSGAYSEREREVLQDIGVHIADFVQKRDKKEQWIRHRDIKDRQFTVMKRIPGGEMYDFVFSPDYETLNPQERYEMASKSVSAILELHNHNILHLDIKPGNMMLDWKGDSAVISAVDYGFSAKLQVGETSILEDRNYGTPSYMAPEIKRANEDGKYVYSKATDVYALGVMLHKDLKIDEKAGSPFHAMVARMLHKDPEKRPSLIQVKSALDNIDNYKQYISCYEYLSAYEEMKSYEGKRNSSGKAKIAADIYAALEEYRVQMLTADQDDVYDINKESATKIIELMRQNRDLNKQDFWAQSSEFNLQVLRSLPNMLKDSVCSEIGVAFDSDMLAEVNISNRKKLATALDVYDIQKDQRVESTGVERKWVKQRKGSGLKVTEEEWAFAKKQMAEQIKANPDSLPFKISFSDHKGNLNHDFIVMDSSEGIKLGCMARNEAFYTRAGERQEEGYLGYGAVGVVSMVQWENGDVDAIKIESAEAEEDDNERKIMEKMGHYLATFTERGDKEREWIRKNRPDQNIKDKKYTVMKRLPGQEFKDWLFSMGSPREWKDLPMEMTVELALKSAVAIQEVHDKDIIFGDFHPGNIMLDWKGDIAGMRMVDFGTSMQLEPGQTSITLDPGTLPGNRPLGTRSYMAPEVGTFDRKKIDPATNDFLWLTKGCRYSKASDMYSVGELFKRIGLSRNPTGMNLIKRLQDKDPEKRPNVEEAIAIVGNIKKYDELFRYAEGKSKSRNPEIKKISGDLLEMLSIEMSKTNMREEKVSEFILSAISSGETDTNLLINIILKSPDSVRAVVAETVGIPKSALEADEKNIKVISRAISEYKTLKALRKAELATKEIQRDADGKSRRMQNTTISVGQAMLILIDKYQGKSGAANEEKCDKLKKLYLSGFRTPEDLNYLEELKREEADVLGKYNISTDFKVIAEEPTRRYFETHLAIQTRKKRLPEVSVDFIENHYKSMMDSIGPQKPKKPSKKDKDYASKLKKYKSKMKKYKSSLASYNREKLAREAIQTTFRAEQPRREAELEALNASLSGLLASIESGSYTGDDAGADTAEAKRLIAEKEKEMDDAKKHAEMNQVENLVRGGSSRLQNEVDKTFCGHFQSDDTDTSSMFREYSDMLSRVDEDDSISVEDKKKAKMLIKCGRLAAVMGRRDARGKDMPGAHIYREGLYASEARGRKTATTEWVPHKSKGLLRSYNPLSEGDEAEASRAFEYFKPADRNTFVDPADWIQKSMGYLVHTYSNSISGTMLAQLKSMALLDKDGTLTLDSTDKIAKFAQLMITTMTEQSGGHSLLEFSSPMFYEPLRQLFKDMPGFDELSFEDIFLRGNEDSFEAALEKSIEYNKTILARQNIHNELLSNKKRKTLDEFKAGGYKEPSLLYELIEINGGEEALEYLKSLGAEGISTLQKNFSKLNKEGGTVAHRLVTVDPNLFIKYVISVGGAQSHSVYQDSVLFAKVLISGGDSVSPIDIALDSKNYAVIVNLMVNAKVNKSSRFMKNMLKAIKSNPEMNHIYERHMENSDRLKIEVEEINGLNEKLKALRERMSVSSREEDFDLMGELASDIANRIRNVQSLLRVVSLECGVNNPGSDENPYFDYVLKVSAELNALRDNRDAGVCLQEAREKYDSSGDKDIFQLTPNPSKQGFIIFDSSGNISVESPIDFAARYSENAAKSLMTKHSGVLQDILSKSKSVHDIENRHKYSDSEIQEIRQRIKNSKEEIKQISPGYSKIRNWFANTFRSFNKKWADRVIAEESVKKRIQDDVTALEKAFDKVDGTFANVYKSRDAIEAPDEVDVKSVLSGKNTDTFITSLTAVTDIVKGDAVQRLHLRDYTFLSPENVYTPAALLGIVGDAYANSSRKKDLVEIVAFKPKRALLQTIAAVMSSDFKLSDGSLDEVKRNEKIQEIFDDLSKDRDGFINEFGDLYYRVGERVRNKRGDDAIESLEYALDIAKNIELPDPRYPGIVKKEELATEIAIMRLYNSEMRSKMGQYVLDKIRDNSAGYGVEPKEPPTVPVGYMCLSNRGQEAAEHLGRIVSSMPESFRGNTAIMSTDSYKSLLVSGVSRLPGALQSYVSNEEAKLISRQACAISKKEGFTTVQDAKDTVDPNFLRYKVKFAQVISGDIVETSRKAFEAGDAASTKISLSAQKKMVEDVMSLISSPAHYKTGHMLALNFISDRKSVGEGVNEFMKVEIDGETRSVKVLNSELLDDFLKKQLINENAEKFSEILPKEPELSERLKSLREKFLKDMQESGLKVEVLDMPNPSASHRL